MSRLNLTIMMTMALLANGGASRDWHASRSALRRREGSLAARPADIHFTECTSSGLPGGGLIEDICADLDIASCGNNITFGLRFKSQRPGTNYIFSQTVDATSSEVCGSSIAGNSISTICGSQAKLCMTFLDPNGVATLKLGPGYASGCPTLDLRDCTILGRTLSYSIPLDCFSKGSSCSEYSSCDKCIENGCGWCTAGYSSDHACMPGDMYGPVCDVCGQGKGCDWNYGVCPVNVDALLEQEKRLNKTIQDLAATKGDLSKLKEKVSKGGDIVIDEKEFECSAFGTMDRELAAASGMTALASILCLIGGTFIGGIFTKMGFVDKVVAYARSRAQVSSGGQGFAGDATGDSSYVPPVL